MKTFREWIQEKEEFPNTIAKYLNEYRDEKYVFTTFAEYLKEAPQSIKGDCYFGQEDLQLMMGNEDFLEEFRWSAVQDYRTLVNKGDKKSKNFIIQTNDRSKAFLGHCDQGTFKILAEMTFREPKTYKGLGTVTEFKTVNTHSKFIKKGFASAIYKSMLADGYILMSDAIQYKGAVKLWKDFINSYEGSEWKSLIDNKKIKVKLYDKVKSKVIYEDLTGIPDDEIWSFNNSKSEYRLIASSK